MANYRVIPTPTTAEKLVNRIKSALAANATSVEIFAKDDGKLEVVVWLDKQTSWGQHTDVS